MIEFVGYIHGSAEKHFQKKARRLGQIILLASLFVFLPVVIVFAIKNKKLIVLLVYCLMFVIVPLLLRIPQSDRERKAITPKRIYINEAYIVSVADKYTEQRRIQDIKCVYDYGDFYDIVFPFGKVSEKFICQKDLLVNATLEEFEQRIGKVTIKMY